MTVPSVISANHSDVFNDSFADFIGGVLERNRVFDPLKKLVVIRRRYIKDYSESRTAG